MKELEPPFRRYTLGKSPSHALTGQVWEAFEGFDEVSMKALLTSAGWLGQTGKPTRKADSLGLLDSCSGRLLWNLEEVEKELRKALPTIKRRYSNQTLDIPNYDGENYVTLTVIASHFNVSAQKVGRWLDDLKLRNEKGLPTKEVIKDKLAIIDTFKTVGSKSKQSRQGGFWEVKRTCELLMAAGHPLDFDYSKSLEGKGRNSDVEVKENAIGARVEEFSKAFAKLYNARDREAIRLVQKTPKLILDEAEALLKRPGLFSRKLYMKRFEN